jgi:hypothetical protein
VFIRNINDFNQSVGNKPLGQLQSKANIYATSFPFDRCSGGLPGSVAFVAIHGNISGVTTKSDIWPQNIVRTLPTAAFTIGVSSSSANDTGAGTGAQTVEIDLLDDAYIPHTITLTLNGQTKVVDTNYVGHAFRINDIRIKTFGTGLSNVGDIYVYDSSDTVTAGVPQTATKIFHRISAAANVARGAFYTVPAGCKMQTQQFRGGFNDTVTTSRAANLTIQFQDLVTGSLIGKNFPIIGQINSSQSTVSVLPDFPVVFDEKTDISLQVVASASSAVTAYLDAVIFYK